MKIEDRGKIKCFCGRVLGAEEIRTRAGEELWLRQAGFEYLEVKEKKENNIQDAVLAAFKFETVGDKKCEGDKATKMAEDDAEDEREKEADEDAGFIFVERQDVEADEEWTFIDIEEAET
ncbi:unnamed protein product [Cercospora beticola]|nr:unnamed protein product [Cercospora beticola]